MSIKSQIYFYLYLCLRDRRPITWYNSSIKTAIPGNFFSNCCSSSKTGSSGNLWSAEVELMTDTPLPDRTLLWLWERREEKQINVKLSRWKWASYEKEFLMIIYISWHSEKKDLILIIYKECFFFNEYLNSIRLWMPSLFKCSEPQPKLG